MVFLEKNRVHNYNRVYMCVQKAFAQGRHMGHLRHCIEKPHYPESIKMAVVQQRLSKQ
jgi:hypothetical protein